MTIFDTDFEPTDRVLCYRGTRCAYAGAIEDMSDELREEFDVNTWFLLDQAHEDFKALFVA